MCCMLHRDETGNCRQWPDSILVLINNIIETSSSRQKKSKSSQEEIVGWEFAQVVRQAKTSATSCETPFISPGCVLFLKEDDDVRTHQQRFFPV